MIVERVSLDQTDLLHVKKSSFFLSLYIICLLPPRFWLCQRIFNDSKISWKIKISWSACYSVIFVRINGTTWRFELLDSATQIYKIVFHKTTFSHARRSSWKIGDLKFNKVSWFFTLNLKKNDIHNSFHSQVSKWLDFCVVFRESESVSCDIIWCFKSLKTNKTEENSFEMNGATRMILLTLIANVFSRKAHINRRNCGFRKIKTESCTSTGIHLHTHTHTFSVTRHPNSWIGNSVCGELCFFPSLSVFIAMK